MQLFREGCATGLRISSGGLHHRPSFHLLLLMKLKTFTPMLLTLALLFLGAGAVALYAYTPEEALKHEGEHGTVEGLIVKIGSSPKGNLFLNMGAPYPKHTFSGVISKSSVEKLGKDYIMSLEGKYLRITGDITIYNEKPEILVSDRKQIEEVAAPTPAPAPKKP